MSWQAIAVGSTSVATVAPVAAFACDPFKELLWVGSSEGALSCCYSPSLSTRVRVQAHPRGQSVLQVGAYQHGVLSTSSAGVRFHSRGGVLQTDFETRSFVDHITAASVLADNFAATEIVLAGIDHAEGRPTLAMMDIATNRLLLQAAANEQISSIASGRVVACGTAGLTLSLHDPRTFQSIRTLPGHQGGSRKVIVKGDRLLSLGYAIAPGADNGGFGRIDNVVKVYDLRTYRPLPPVVFTLSGGPADACFLPNFSSTIVVVGLSGTWQTLDCEAGVPGAEAYAVDLDSHCSVSALAMSSTGDLMFVGDTHGGVHAWSDKTAQVADIAEIMMNPYSAPVEYVSSEIEPPPVHMDEFTPLVALPLPAYVEHESLLSNLAPLPQETNFISPSTSPVDEQLLHQNYHIKTHEFIGYIDLSSGRHRGNANTVDEYGFEQPKKSAYGAGGGISVLPNRLNTLSKYCGKGRSTDKLHKKKALPRFGDAFGRHARDALLISKEYARVTIKIPRFGLYAFDFSSYNKTDYTGLDNLLPNSYCNPIIQLLYFIPSIRSALRAHLCERESCLTCELGFLFHMLDHGRGNTAEPRNFLRALRQLPEAAGLGLLDMHENTATIQSPTSASSQAGSSIGGGGGLKNRTADDDDELFLASKIQDFWRFLLEQLHKEERESAPFQQALAEKQHQLSQMQYTFNMSQQRRHRNLTMTLAQLQQSFVSLQQTMSAQGQPQHGAVEHLRGQLQRFVAQNQQLYDESEKVETDLFSVTLASVERELTRAQQTTIERVFGAQLEHRITCQGTMSMPPHEALQSKTALYWKLNAYPTHETDLTFDQLLTSSLHDAASGTQRLFCNSCSAFTIQRHAKSLQAARVHRHAAPEPSFPRALNVMANVANDMQWEWWKRRDDRFKQASARRGGVRPANLYERFMAAGGDSTGADSYSAPGGGSNRSRGSGADHSEDAHFLPQFLLIFISRDDGSNQQNQSGASKSTRAFRIQRAAAHRIQSSIAALRSLQQSHFASAGLLTQTMLATQVNASNMQQQLMVLQQQAFLVHSKLNCVISQQQSLIHSAHTLAQQAQQAPNQNVAAMIARQTSGVQNSLQAIASQSQQLQAQKLAIAQKVAAVQSATANATGGASASGLAAGMGGGLSGLQGKVQLLQAQLSQLQQAFSARMVDGEAELRHLITSHLSEARTGSGGVEPFDPASFNHASVDDLAVYELSGVVAHIADPPEKDSPLHTINGEHLVAHIKVERDVYDRPEEATATRRVKQLTPTSPAKADRFSYGSSQQSFASPHSPTTKSLAVTAEQHDGSWFVFNDFVIRPSNGREATQFAYEWKQPCAVVYKIMDDQPESTDAAAAVTSSLKAISPPLPIASSSSSTALAINSSTSPRAAAGVGGSQPLNPFMHERVLYSYAPSLSARYRELQRSFQPLVAGGPHVELMDASTMVAIDCEFVSVQPELLDADNETGEAVVVRPARLTLARVSVVRGTGPLSGVPFIDDYIATSEPVVDYLTQYSGIVPGDLDRAASPHYLTTLKHAYVRLRALVERGVRFIGHGLKKDLQMLNISIPSEQVCDTVDLFSLPHQRKLGLRFLARHLLQINIQQDTHDSIEDARTALQLYHKYIELKGEGKLAQCLQDLYTAGHRSGFKL